MALKFIFATGGTGSTGATGTGFSSVSFSFGTTKIRDIDYEVNLRSGSKKHKKT